MSDVEYVAAHLVVSMVFLVVGVALIAVGGWLIEIHYQWQLRRKLAKAGIYRD